jgi:hypothetical protein
MLTKRLLSLISTLLLLAGCAAKTTYVRSGFSDEITGIQWIFVMDRFSDPHVAEWLEKRNYYDARLAERFARIVRENAATAGIITSVEAVPALTPNTVKSDFYLVVRPARATQHRQTGVVVDMTLSATLFQRAKAEPDHVLWIGSVQGNHFEDAHLKWHQVHVLKALQEQGILHTPPPDGPRRGEIPLQSGAER